MGIEGVPGDPPQKDLAKEKVIRAYLIPTSEDSYTPGFKWNRPRRVGSTMGLTGRGFWFLGRMDGSREQNRALASLACSQPWLHGWSH